MENDATLHPIAKTTITMRKLLFCAFDEPVGLGAEGTRHQSSGK
jgi:hypothetical protein